MKLLADTTASTGFEPLPFMIRRVFRIYPLWIATSLIFFLSLLVTGRAGSYGTTGFFCIRSPSCRQTDFPSMIWASRFNMKCCFIYWSLPPSRFSASMVLSARSPSG
jgi:peptidoglycan/LPS O-acetylase OafA/YrhL